MLEQSSQNELMSFMLVFLSTPYMKNPYLKGQFVEVRLSRSCRAAEADRANLQIMYYLSRPTYTSPRGCLGDVINFHDLALKNLMPCLVHAYIGARTRSSAQSLRLIHTGPCRNRDHRLAHAVLRQVQHPLLHHAAVQARVE